MFMKNFHMQSSVHRYSIHSVTVNLHANPWQGKLYMHAYVIRYTTTFFPLHNLILVFYSLYMYMQRNKIKSVFSTSYQLLYPSWINPSAEIGQELITWHRIFPPWKQHIQIAKSGCHDFKHIQNISILSSCVLNQWRSIMHWLIRCMHTHCGRRCAGSAAHALIALVTVHAIERNNNAINGGPQWFRGGKFKIYPPTPTTRFDCIPDEGLKVVMSWIDNDTVKELTGKIFSVWFSRVLYWSSIVSLTKISLIVESHWQCAQLRSITVSGILDYRPVHVKIKMKCST